MNVRAGNCWRAGVLLTFVASAAGAQSGGGPGAPQSTAVARLLHAGTVGFVAPPGWKVVRVANDRTQFSGTTTIARDPAPPGGCIVVVTPVLNDASDAAAFGVGIVNALLPAQLRPFGARGLARYDGVHGKGWRFVDLYADVGDPRANVAAHVVVADLGGRKVAMVGLMTSVINTNVYALAPEPVPVCLAGQDNDDWVAMFLALQIPGYEADAPALGRELVGSWSHMGKVALVLSFGEHGEFSRGGASGYMLHNVRPGKSEEHTTSVASDGRYLVKGDRLYTACAQGCEFKKYDYISVVRKSDPKAPGGGGVLLRMITFSDDGRGRIGNMTLNYSRDP